MFSLSLGTSTALESSPLVLKKKENSAPSPSAKLDRFDEYESDRWIQRRPQGTNSVAPATVPYFLTSNDGHHICPSPNIRSPKQQTPLYSLLSLYLLLSVSKHHVS